MKGKDKEINNTGAEGGSAGPELHICTTTTITTRIETPLPEKRLNDGITRKLLWTSVVFFAHACLGLLISSLGPAFLDLLLIVDEDIGRGSIIFTSQAIGGVTGGLLSGVFYDRFRTESIFSIALLLCSLSNIVIPYCASLWLMCVVVALRGMLMYLMLTGCALICVRTWRHSEGTAVMQALHFAYSVGGVIGPFITSEYLVERPDEDAAWNTSKIPETKSNVTELDIAEESRVHVAFLIISVITALCSMFCFGLILFDRVAKSRAQSTEATDRKERSYTAVAKKKSDLALPVRIGFFASIVLYFMMVVAIETLNQNYIPTFVVMYFGWTKRAGARIAAAFWGSFAAGRFLGIFTAKFLTPWKFMTVDLIFLSAAAIVLVTAVDMHFIVIWIWVCVSGLFIAGLYGCGCSFVDIYIMRLSGKIYSTFLVAETSSSIVYPLILGTLIENSSPIWFVYLAVIICGLSDLVLLSLSMMVMSWGKAKRAISNAVELTDMG